MAIIINLGYFIKKKYLKKKKRKINVLNFIVEMKNLSSYTLD